MFFFVIHSFFIQIESPTNSNTAISSWKLDCIYLGTVTIFWYFEFLENEAIFFVIHLLIDLNGSLPKMGNIA